jgi:hypothetical protein
MNPAPIPATNAELPRAQDGFGPVLRDAAIVVVAASLVGVVANLLRSDDRLAWIQKTPYDTLVPCSEPVGQATAIGPEDPSLQEASSLVIDARASSEFGAWHLPRAINVPFDWLGPPVREEVERVAHDVAKSRSRRVVVYGDGDDPDSGREWARLLAGGGIKNVSYVNGGGPALRARAGKAGGQ